MPLVSVIIPTFNRFEQTAEAIRSALAQTEKDIEIVVVDDVSTDSSLAKLRETFPLNNVKFVSTGVNSGAATGRNVGVAESSGSYVAFLDSDDVWFPNKISRQIEFLKSQKFSADELVLVYAAARSDSGLGLSRPIGRAELVEDYIFVEEQHMQTSGWLLSRKVFNRVRFTPGLKRHQDLDFVIRAQALGAKFVMPPEALYEWRAGTHADHVGTIRDDGISLDWLASVRPLINTRAYHHFSMKYVFPCMVPRNTRLAAKIAISAAKGGHLLLVGRFVYRSLRAQRWGLFGD